MKKDHPVISVVVPCYNEEQVLPFYYSEMNQLMDQMKQVEFEIIFVDDGSSDDTLNTLKQLNKKDKRCKYIAFSRNFGKEAALYAGLDKTQGKYVVVMDADLQDPPPYIPQMYEILQTEDYDCVATYRSDRKGERAIRSLFSKMFYRVINRITQVQMKQGARDYRMMKRGMVDALLSLKEKNRFSKGMFEWVGFRTKWLEYHNVERVAGDTKWSFLKLTKYAIDGIIGFSTFPLTLVSWIGLVF